MGVDVILAATTSSSSWLNVLRSALGPRPAPGWATPAELIDADQSLQGGPPQSA
jgi:hypothetical protein